MPETKQKKIIFLTNLNILGGTENNLVSIVTHPEFMNAFHSWIFSGTRPHPVIMSRLKKTDTKVIQHNTLMGIRTPRILRDRLFKRHLRKIRPDIVVFWNHVAKSRQLSICKELSIKTVFFERGTGWRDHNPTCMKRFLTSVDRVLSNSRAGGRILSARWGYEGECLVLPNAVRPEIASSKAEGVKYEKNRALRIGVAARLVAYKGVASAVLAMKELKNQGVKAELHIAGDGPEADILRSLSSDLNVRTRFYGAIDDMAGFYRKIDILVVPSIREPFGTVAIEAQALGRPVLCSAVDGLPEVIIQGKTGYFIEPTLEIEGYLEFAAQKNNIPGLVYYPQKNKLNRPKALDPGKIASVIAQMISDPGKITRMSNDAAVLIREKFNFEKYVRNLIENIRRIIESPSRP